MIKAIVYTSNTGFTKNYAELLSKELSLPCCSIEDAEKQIKKGDDIIFLGWLMAGSIKGLKKAKKTYNVRATAGVGMAEPTAENLSTLKKMNKLENTPCFYLRGGLDIDKLHGISKLILKTANSASAKKEGKEPSLCREDYVSTENLSELITWYKGNK